MPEDVQIDNLADAAEDSAAVADASEQLAAMTAERDELKDLLLRRQAEFDNYRRRSDRERVEFAEYASMDTVRSLLPTLDDFERALKAAQAAEPGGGELMTGVELIYQRLADVLKKLGLQAVPAVGQKFDPHVHYAVDREQDSDAEEGAILAEYQTGYNFKGKLLRPAMVKVAVRPETQ